MVEDTSNLMARSRQQIKLSIFFIRGIFFIRFTVFEILSVFWKLAAKNTHAAKLIYGMNCSFYNKSMKLSTLFLDTMKFVFRSGSTSGGTSETCQGSFFETGCQKYACYSFHIKIGFKIQFFGAKESKQIGFKID